MATGGAGGVGGVSPATGAPGVSGRVREVLGGAATLRRGFGMWRLRPGLMLLGMLPALLVLVVLAAAYVALCLEIGHLTALVTPFADGWSDTVREVLRFLLGLAILVGALVLATSVFTGLTLAVGDPFYERIWRGTETMLGGPQPGEGPGLLTAVADGAKVAGVGVLIAAGLFVAGFLPVIGQTVGSVLGVTIAGRLLAQELLTRPLEARGLDRRARADLYRPRSGRVLGFGVATQVWFLVPLAAIVMMPAAVVGATLLSRELLGLPAELPVPGTTGPTAVGTPSRSGGAGG